MDNSSKLDCTSDTCGQKFLDVLREHMRIRFTGIITFKVELNQGGVRYVNKVIEEKLKI